jgi:hypothetical protein
LRDVVIVWYLIRVRCFWRVASPMSRLTAVALILAALAVVAYITPESQPACIEGRPVFGARACCETHSKAARLDAFMTVTDLESVRRGRDATKVTQD